MIAIRSNALIAAGANLPSETGDPASTIAAALQQVKRFGHTIKAISRFFETPCFPAGAGPDYVNAVMWVQTPLGASDILATLHNVEMRFGRTRDTRWGQRTLDLDLLAIDDLVLPESKTVTSWMALPPDRQRLAAPDRLLVPHPRIQDRAFVLVPLMDIAPEWRHPLLGKTVRQMHEALPGQARADIRPI